MTTKTYILPQGNHTQAILSDIIFAIPCFVSAKDINGKLMEFTIQARDADIPFVERMLAPLM